MGNNRRTFVLIGLAVLLCALSAMLIVSTQPSDDGKSESRRERTESGSRTQRLSPDRSEDAGSAVRKSAGRPVGDPPTGIITTESGLQYEVLREGSGPRPGPNERVVVEWNATLEDGTEIDGSHKRKRPDVFPVSGVIKGWREGLQLMPTGSRFKLIVPPELAYGDRKRDPYPTNATVTFEIELISIEEKK